jgi:hypothetical protein
VLDVHPECGFVGSTDGSYFVAESLRNRLMQAHVQGCRYQEALVVLSHDYHMNTPTTIDRALPRFFYLQIMSTIDGPWKREKGTPCAVCGNDTIRPGQINDPELLLNTTTFVYADSWDQADIFYLTEPGNPIVTEKVATILRAHGDLRQEPVPDKDLLQQFMPKYAAMLERNQWMQDRCSSLQPAAWI